VATRWGDLTTFGLRHWVETVRSEWTGGMVKRSHPTQYEVYAALPADVRRWYDAARAWNDADHDGEWPTYGAWSGGDPREWVPDLESNSEDEIRHWAAACALYAQGDALRPEPTYPDHPLGCTRDERFGLGSTWIAWPFTDEEPC